MHYNGKGNDKALWDLEMEILWGVFEKGAVHPFKTSINQNDEWVKFDQIMYDKDHTSKTSEEWKTAILNCGVENIFLIDEKSNKQTYGISNEKGEFIVDFKFSVQPQNGDKNGRMHLATINAEYYNNKNNFDMAKKYTKSEIEGMIKNLKEKEKKARSKWGKAVLQDAQWLLENVLENMKDGEEVEINETLLLNGAKSWKDFSYGGCAYVANIDIARHYATPSQFKQLEKKDWEISENETLYDVQARALRQAWWAIRDEMNGTTEFSMSLCNFSYQDVEGPTIKDSLTKTNFDMTKVVWKINGKDEQSKEFDNFLDAMKFQGEIVKKYKKKLEYAEYKKIGKSNFDMGNSKNSNGMKLEIYNPKGELVNTITDKDSCVARLIEMLWAKSEKIEKVKMTSTMIEGEEIATFTEHFSNGYKYVLSGVPMNHGYINATKIVNSNNFSLACGSKSNFDMDNPLDEYWDLLIGHGIATKGELQLITSINGYTGETLNDVLYARTGYRSWEQYCDANGIEIDDDDDDDDDDTEFSMKSNFEIVDGMVLEIYDKNGNLANTITDERSLRRNLTEILWAKAQKMGKSVKIGRTYYDKNGYERCDIKQTFNDGGVYLLKGVPTNWGYLDTMKIGFSIIDDTKGVLKATGKLAGNIVKNTTDKGGLLMF